MTAKKSKELRLKGSSTILGYIKRFSATEKTVFALFVIAISVTAIVMASRVNHLFTTEVSARGGTLREGLVGLPHTVNPVLAVTDVDRDISSLVYAGLTRYSNGNVVPDLASDWTVSDDGLTYTFNLLPNLEFQDGTALTADDVLFTVSKIQDPALKSPRLADWAGVTATSTGPGIIEFILKKPYASFLSNTTIGIIPKHIWGSVSNDQFIFSEYNVRPIGAGAYRIMELNRDKGGIPTSYRLSTWNKYHAAKPYIENIIFSFFSDEDHALSALSNGAVDSISSVSPSAAADLASNIGEPYTVVSSTLTRVFGVFLNQNTNRVFADLPVRQALNTSLDRELIVKNVLSGYGRPMSGPLPKALSASSSQDILPDMAAAQALLRKNGWVMGTTNVFEKRANKKSATTTLAFTLYTSNAPDLKATADLLKAAWTELGAQVTVKIFDPSDLYQNVIRTRSYDALLFGEAPGRNNDLYPFWHSSERNAPGLNVAMYTNSKVDKVLENIRTAGSQDSLAGLYGQLDQLIRSDVPAIFLYSPDFIYAVPKSLEGISLGMMITPTDRFASIADWYIETERVWDIFAH